MASSLPFDLIIRIIEQAYYLYARGPKADIKTLTACSAVCKQWSSFTRNLLFFKVVALPTPTSNRFLKGLALMAGQSDLGARIRSLTVLSREQSGADFITLLAHCPALYDLHLIVNSATPELAAPDTARLAALPTTLRSLKLTLCHTHPPSRVLYQLMAAWPNIQFLHLTEIHSIAPPPSARPPFSLYELSLDGRAPYPEPLLRWLLPPAPGSLRVLALPFETDPTSSVLAAHAPSVRSLRLSCNVRPPPPAFLARFSALEELVLGDVCVDVGTPALPRTMQHLRISMMNRLRPSDVRCLEALVGPGFPCLNRVSVDLAAQPKPAGLLGGLESVCEGKGVELAVSRFEHPSDVWRWKREYPVRMDHFPRDWTIDNLYCMNAGD